MTVSVGLLSAGRIGLIHAGTLANHPGARLAAIADPSDAAADAVTGLTGARRAERDEVLSGPQIDAVIIATPTDLHAAQVEQAARAGKAIFCEKPIDLDLARVRACLSVVQETGARLMIGFNRRFDTEFQALKQRIESGAIGEIESIHLTSRDHAPPPIAFLERSGGIFRDMMIHDFDMARFLMDEEFTEVFATGSVLIDPDIGAAGDFDTATATLKTASGRIAVITCSRRASYGHDQRAEIQGSKGMATIGNRRETSVTVADAGGYHRDPLLPSFIDRYAEAYRRELAAFIDAVATGAPMSPNGGDGLHALELADAALRSSGSGKAVRL